MRFLPLSMMMRGESDEKKRPCSKVSFLGLAGTGRPGGWLGLTE